jgi:amino acid adenylation domain-containing protein
MSTMGAVAALLQKGVQLFGHEDKLQFRAPRGALSASDQELLRANKRAILDLLRGGRAARLSGMQERLWFLSRLDTSGLGYVFTFAYRIKGPLDAREHALSRALNEIIHLHPGLRATFVEFEGTPVQLFSPPFALEIPLIDCRCEPPEAAIARIREALVKPFDLERGPLLRSALFRITEDEHIWGIALHHLIGDGRTFGVILDDISALLAGSAPDMRGRLDYTDYLEWERARAERPEALENLRYWITKLANLQELDLPLDHPRPAVRTHDGARTTFPLSRSLSERIHAFARAEDTTLFAVLLSLYAVLLGRATGHDDIAVGSPHANRPESAFERTAGCFVSTLVLRVDLSGSPDFREVVRRVARVCAEAWDHREYAYEKLAADLGVARDTSKNALFQPFFALQNTLGDLRIPGARAELFQFDTGNIQFDLEVHFFLDTQKALSGVLLYNRNLFEEATMQRMAERWARLAEALLDAPGRPIASIPLLSEEEGRLLAEWNRTEAEYPREKRFDQLFVEQAKRTPGRAAVVFRGRRATYAELSATSAAICEKILATAGRGAAVGIFVERSFEMVAAVLGVARAGAIFVPLDPDLPQDRIAFMVRDGGLRHAITNPELSSRLPAGIEPIFVDKAVSAARVDSDRMNERSADGAYILYTSGSTGRPKGVLVGHRALTNLLCAMAKAPSISIDDVFMAVTSLSFDISLLELFLPLLHGATLVVAARDEVLDPRKLAALLETSGATRMQATPSMWRMLLDAGPPPMERLVALCGGEALSRDLADRLLARCKEVWNLYGPTETTVWSARWKVSERGPVRIGRPIENTRFYLVTPQGKLAPPGAPGELFIAGDGLAAGYVNRSDETARRFVDLVDIAGRPERAYKTGDLARQLADGSLVFLGRTDDQLKVRGHRVEPEEIEHALRAHPGVREAVITLAPGGALIAHVLAEPAYSLSERALRDFVTASLPAYMVPQRCLLHRELPVTATGKTDRQALAALPLGAPPETSAYEPPVGEVETFVARLFADVLGLERVGRCDDFFRIGGHSLVAARVLYGIKQRYGAEIQLHELFQASTVAALSARVQSASEAKASEDRAIVEALERLESMSEEEAALLLQQISSGTSLGN